MAAVSAHTCNMLFYLSFIILPKLTTSLRSVLTLVDHTSHLQLLDNSDLGLLNLTIQTLDCSADLSNS